MSIRHWKGDEARELIRAEVRRRLSAACIVVSSYAKELISVAGTGVFKEDAELEAAGLRPKRRPGVNKLHWTKVRRLVQEGKIVLTRLGSKAKRIFGAFPSKPGEPPRKQTGRLRGSVTYEVDEINSEIVGRVGTNVAYGKYLELGTRRMAPRPWLRRSLMECQDQVNTILQRPMKLPDR